jgi:hypothetical protein
MSKVVACPSCGFKNPDSAKRCASCGASGDGPRSVRAGGEGPASKRYQQTAFSVTWLGISLAVLVVLTGAIVIGLPMFVKALDFEGRYGMIVSIPVWFLGGLLVGMVSPGKTFAEPTVAALFVSIPTVAYLVKTQTVRTMDSFMYVIMACIGIMFTMVGAYLGERIQMGPPPKPVE